MSIRKTKKTARSSVKTGLTPAKVRLSQKQIKAMLAAQGIPANANEAHLGTMMAKIEVSQGEGTFRITLKTEPGKLDKVQVGSILLEKGLEIMRQGCGIDTVLRGKSNAAEFAAGTHL